MRPSGAIEGFAAMASFTYASRAAVDGPDPIGVAPTTWTLAAKFFTPYSAALFHQTLVVSASE